MLQRHAPTSKYNKTRQKNLYDLTIDPLAALSKYLSPEDMSALASVNQQLRVNMQRGHTQLVWRDKFIQHFPHHFEPIKNQADVNWRQAFVTAYRADYINLPNDRVKLSKNKRRVFSATKEGDLATLKTLKMAQPYDYFFKIFDAKNNAPLVYALQLGHQHILDYFYQSVLTRFRSQINIDIDAILDHRTDTRLIDHAFICRQSVEVITSLMARTSRFRDSGSFRDTGLYHAIENERLDLVDALLSQDEHLVHAVYYYYRPISLAVDLNMFEITERLLVAGS